METCVDNVKSIPGIRTMLVTAQRFIPCNQIPLYLSMCREQGVTDEELKLFSGDYVKMNGDLYDESQD